VTFRGGADEERLPGAVGAVRVGPTVRKECGPWTPTIHALLRFLYDVGDLAPQPLGRDEQGREVLSWIEGAPACWRAGRGRPGAGEVVCHGDFARNTIWRDLAIIDGDTSWLLENAAGLMRS